ncbi:MAG: ATP-binding cassette domain-containing protein [Bacteroidota bacterium]
MKIECKQVFKRFDREWIVRQFSHTFEPGRVYGISGPNGSGKSTLLRILAGHLTPGRGQILFTHRDQKIPASKVYTHLTICGPYIELIEELKLIEAIEFHFRFKPLLPEFSLSGLPQVLQLHGHQNRLVSTFSSGMRQRLQLGLALTSASPFTILDEPTVTLDAKGKQWYQDLLKQCKDDRLLIIASNEMADLEQCDELIKLG